MDDFITSNPGDRVRPEDVVPGDHLRRTLRPGDATSVLTFTIDKMGLCEGGYYTARTTDGSWLDLNTGVLTRV